MTMIKKRGLGISLLLVIVDMGCGQSLSTLSSVNVAKTKCNAGVAEVFVGDGYLQTLCGCNGAGEENGTIFPFPKKLSCHLGSKPTTVFFYFSARALPHQIVSIGSPSFVSSSLSDPQAGNPIRVHAVSFKEGPATYAFKDLFGGMTGQIVVP